MTRLILLLLALCLFTANAEKPRKKTDCPKYGDATTTEKKHLNRMKNRGVSLSGDPEFVALNNFLPSRQREEKDMWSENAYIYTEGYITDFKEEGGESCNCKQAHAKDKDGDVHIYIGLRKNAPKKNCMVVEITPAYKALHPDYADHLVKGGKYRIYGYLLYDTEHTDAAFTTCTSCSNVWRKTNWEIHPITKMEVVE